MHHRSKIFFLIILFFCSCNKESRKLPYYNTSQFTPIWEEPLNDDFHRIRSFTLIDQQGKEFTEKNLDDKISVVDFFFTSCPGICPKMTQNMSELQTYFIANNQVQLVSHSVTPDKDNVTELAKYAKLKKVDYQKWKLLTGSKQDIYELGRKFYFVEEDLGENRDSSIFLHTENFILIDKQRRIRGIYNGIDKSSMKSLILDIECLEEEGKWF